MGGCTRWGLALSEMSTSGVTLDMDVDFRSIVGSLDVNCTAQCISVQLVVPHGFDVVEVEWSEHLKKWPCWMYVYWLSELLAKLKTHKRNFETLPSHEKCSSLMNDVLTWSQQLTSHRLGGL